MKALTTIICLAIPFPRPRRRLRTWMKHKFPGRTKLSDLLRLIRYARNRNVVLWFDHSLGGGTETYSLNQFAQMRKSSEVIIRIQYFPANKMFGLSAPNNTRLSKYMVNSLSGVYDAVHKMNISQIVVNNLVGYPLSTDILGLVAELKNQNNAFVSFRGHDFQSICPSFNLINCDGAFCNFKYKSGCETCWRNKKLGNNEYENGVLRSGATSVAKWRAAWGHFFAETADQIIVFSASIGKMFAHIYPQLQEKIVIIPHAVQPLRRVNIAPHDGINIACLGYMQEVKGRDIILDMCNKLRASDNVHITVIGDMDGRGDIVPNLTVTGRYKPSDLPDIIERRNIDLIFIPSIWPETFSYTTAEAMSMGLPVACYDMGAPAERVGEYARGLVLSEINPEKNLHEIIEFIQKLKRN